MLENAGEPRSSSDRPATEGSGEDWSNFHGEDNKDVRMEDISCKRDHHGSGRGDSGSRGGNRWPRPETLALLKIRSEMDSVFRDSTIKAPLWEEVSRKMGELGYKRSAKKCKEKFENVYKYHRRTKEGRSGKSEGKTYRFFDQIEALENLHSNQSEPKPQPPNFIPTTFAPNATAATVSTTTTTIENATTGSTLLPWIGTHNPSTNTTNTSSLKHHVSVAPVVTNPVLFAKQPFGLPFVANSNTFNSGYNQSFTGNASSLNLFSSSTSSSTASDEEQEGKRSTKKRRYWKGLFKKLTKELMEKQEEMQKKFLETLEKREKERIAREEAWRVQETSRINREHEILNHERSMATAKDAAVISFLQKVSGQQSQWQQKQQKQQQQKQSEHQQLPPPQSGDTISFQPIQEQERNIEKSTTIKVGNGSSNHLMAPSPSRWPKAEVEALIGIRTNLDSNYQENATKGSLWEEISVGMRGLGYNRSAKRCKEKWENINKYFKKVKESNKKRPEDSKTCPYFRQLDAIYRERNKIVTTALPLMVAPEQQLPLAQETQNQTNERRKVETEDNRFRDDEGVESEEGQEDEEEEEEQETCHQFEMVLKKTCSSMDINSNIIA